MAAVQRADGLVQLRQLRPRCPHGRRPPDSRAASRCRTRRSGRRPPAGAPMRRSPRGRRGGCTPASGRAAPATQCRRPRHQPHCPCVRPLTLFAVAAVEPSPEQDRVPAIVLPVSVLPVAALDREVRLPPMVLPPHWPMFQVAERPLPHDEVAADGRVADDVRARAQRVIGGHGRRRVQAAADRRTGDPDAGAADLRLPATEVSIMSHQAPAGRSRCPPP